MYYGQVTQRHLETVYGGTHQEDIIGTFKGYITKDTKKILRAVHLLRNKGCGKGGKPFYDIKSQSGKGGGVMNYEIQY